jgi:hypothetical protein
LKEGGGTILGTDTKPIAQIEKLLDFATQTLETPFFQKWGVGQSFSNTKKKL